MLLRKQYTLVLLLLVVGCAASQRALRGDSFGSTSPPPALAATAEPSTASIIGPVALLVTVVGLGSSTVPMKLPPALRGPPFALIMVFSTGAMIAGAVLLVALTCALPDGSFSATATAPPDLDDPALSSTLHALSSALAQLLHAGRWGSAAACAYAPGKILQLWSVRRVGVGVSTGVIASINSVVAFAFVGVTLLGDAPAHLRTAIFGVALLLAGAVGMTLCKSMSGESKTASRCAGSSKHSANKQSPELQTKEQVAAVAIVSPKAGQHLARRSSSILGGGSGGGGGAVAIQIPTSSSNTSSTTGSTGSDSSSCGIDGLGLFAAAISGICLGLQSLPFRLGSSAGSGADAGAGEGVDPTMGGLAPLATAAVFLLAQAPLTMALLVGTGAIRIQGTWQWLLGALGRVRIDNASIAEYCTVSSDCVAATDVEMQMPMPMPTVGEFRRATPRDAVAAAALALIGGLIFSAAAVGQVLTVSAYGASVGMPLTQLNLVVAGMWGIFFFGEIKGALNRGGFFAAAAAAMAGGYLLAHA